MNTVQAISPSGITAKNLKQLLVIIFVFTLIRIVILITSDLGLHGDEAQYWSWSQDLDWGYYTKPPFIAWLIYTTTSVFGNMEWAVRLGSPLLHAGTSFLCAIIAEKLYGQKAMIWTGVVFLTLPAVSFSSCIISTDVPLLFFWSLSLYSMIAILESKHLVWAISLGVAVGLGLLSKYAMGYFFICTIIACILIEKYRWFLLSPHMILALTVALCIIAPNIFWNMSSGWATVAHLGDNINLRGELFNIKNTASFLAEQIGIFGPILFCIMLLCTAKSIIGKSAPHETWLLCYVLPIIGIVTVQAFLSRANANWAATAYIAGTILVTGWLIRNGPKWILWISSILHILVMGTVVTYFLGVAGIEPPLKSDPLRKLRGWPETAQKVVTTMSNYPNHILLTDDRKVMASLIYGLRNTRYRPVMWDYDGYPNHHYELTARYWPEPNDKVILVAKWDYPYPILKEFSSNKSIGNIEVTIGLNRKRRLHLYELKDFGAD